MTIKDPPLLRRYTNLASAIHILRHSKLTLLNPAQWQDRNDAFSMGLFKRRKGLQTLLALCLTADPERFHHWSLFTEGMDGVLLEFKREPLQQMLETHPSLTCRLVRYEPIDYLERNPPPLEDLPFLKRIQYKGETEYRVIYCSGREKHDFFPVEIKLSWIHKIRLSPWLTPALFGTLCDTLRSFNGCESLVIERSELLENERWKSALDVNGRSRRQ